MKSLLLYMRAWRIPALFVLAVTLVTVAMAVRIRTYTTGQDPRTFILLANQLLADPGSMASLMKFIVPGWPLWLAGTMALFGLHAAFWANIPLFVLLCFLLQRLFARLSGSETRAAWMALFCPVALFAGYAYNPHFLLWSFRQTPIYLTGILALLCLQRAGVRCVERRNRGAAVYTGFALLWVAAGIAVRETGVLMLPAMVLFLLCAPYAPPSPNAPHTTGAMRVRMLLLFCGPLVLAAVAGGIFLLVSGISLFNSQNSFFLDLLPNLINPQLFIQPLRTMAGFIFEELGWCLTPFLLIGLWQCRRHRAFFFLFLIPALTYLLFDGLIKIHRRFFLSCYFFLMPVVALGFSTALSFCCGLLLASSHRLRARLDSAGRWPREIPRLLWLLPVVALLFWGGFLVFHAHRWAPGTSAGDIASLQRALNAHLSPGGVVLLDARTRFLRDALEIFCPDVPLLDPASPEAVPRLVSPPIFIRPLNKAGIHPAINALKGEQLLLQRGRLESLPDAEFALGDSRYNLDSYLPWSQTNVTESLPPPPPGGGILQLIAPPPNDASPRTFLHASVAGTSVERVALRFGFNWILVPLDAPPPADAPLKLSVESDQPIPDSFQPQWLPVDAPIQMGFGEANLPTAEAYLSPEFFEFAWVHAPVKEYPYYVARPMAREFGGEGNIDNPIHWPPSTSHVFIVTFGLCAVHEAPDDQMTATLSFGNITRTLSLPHTSKPIPVTFNLGIPSIPPETFHLSMAHIGGVPEKLENPRKVNFSLNHFSIARLPVTNRLDIAFGSGWGTPYVQDGCFARQVKDHGRWTAADAFFFLPLLPQTDYRLRVTFQTHRPVGAPPPAPTFFLNGQPLAEATAEENGDDSLQVRTLFIPADCVHSPSNQLRIASVPWTPSEYGSSDSRELGLFLKNIQVAPATAP